MTTAVATPATHRAELAVAEQQLLKALDRPDGWAREPSGLPGWSRGHVVAHLLGNLEGMLNLVTWATSGEPTPMYASPEARQADIDSRSGWPMARLRGELNDRSAEFALACESLVEPLPCHHLRLGSGAPAEAWQLPMLRVREIEIHRVDLADDYRPQDWSAAFVVRTLGQVHPTMVDRGTLPVAQLRATDTGRAWQCGGTGPDLWGQEADLLAWLIGRPHGQLTLRPPVGRAPAPTAGSTADVVPAAPPWA